MEGVAGVRAARLVGRAAEMQRMHAAATLARSGVPTVLLVEGEAGIGKSSLVREAMSSLVIGHDALMIGHGVDLAGGELPFGLVADALRDLLRRVGVDALRDASPRAVDTLSGLSPALATGSPVERTRAEIFDAFVALVAAVGRDRLLWLVVEDLHWADTSSRDLLGYVVRVVGPAKAPRARHAAQ